MGYLKVKKVKRPSDGYEFECLDKSKAVGCVLFNHDYTKVLLVNQFRAGASHNVLEIPAGLVDPGETDKEAMIRELLEETGYLDGLDDVHSLGEFLASPGYTNEIISLWSARVRSGFKPQAQKLYGGEQITLHWTPVRDVKNVSPCMKTQLAIRMALEIPKTRIGIFGGTFNPITYLHLMTAERAREELKLDKLIFEPVADTYVKESIIPSEHRVKMIELAIENNKKFECGTYEVSKTMQSVSIDTLDHYQEQYGWVDIFFICGSDVLSDMPNWPRTRELLQKFDVVCIQRNGDSVYRDIILKDKVLLEFEHKIHIIYENVTNDISSSELRNLVSNDRSIKYLTPDGVIDYIYKNKLYK